MPRFLLPGLLVTILVLLGTGLATAQEIRIGLAGPITGPNAAYGEQMKRGAMMAVADINARGGVLGKMLVLKIADDACTGGPHDPKPAVAAASQLVEKKVVFVVGHDCSSSSIAASAVYNEAGILQITPASIDTALTDEAAKKGWTNVFRTCGRGDEQGILAGAFLALHYKGKAIAVIHDNSVYGKGIADETRKAMNADGLRETMYEEINQGDQDFSALISKMKQKNISVIYFGGYAIEAGLLVRQAHSQGLNAQFIGGSTLITKKFWNIAGPAGEGALMTFAPDPRKLPAAMALVDRFMAQGYDPEGRTLYTYAAIQAFAAAATQANSVKETDLSQALHTMTVDTVVGPLTWDRKGDVINFKYVLYVWRAGKYADM